MRHLYTPFKCDEFKIQKVLSYFFCGYQDRELSNKLKGEERVDIGGYFEILFRIKYKKLFK